MKQNADFKIERILADGSKAETISGSLAELVAGKGPKLPLIATGELFTIEVAVGIDAIKLVSFLSFDSNIDDPFSDSERVDDWIQNWYSGAYEYPEFGARSGCVRRAAVLLQGLSAMQIVGISAGDRTVLALANFDYLDLASWRYESYRALGGGKWFSGGQSTMQWEGNFALLDLGDFWVEVVVDDFETPDKAYPKPEDFGRGFVDWLQLMGLVNIYLFSNLKSLWRKKLLARRYFTCLDYVANCQGALRHLNAEEQSSLGLALKGMDSNGSLLYEILLSVEHAYSLPLVLALEDAVENGNFENLLGGDGLIEALEKYAK